MRDRDLPRRSPQALALAGFLRTSENLVSELVGPEGERDTVRDVLATMLAEHRVYRRSIRGQWGEFETAPADRQMAIDQREQLAERLAAARAAARLEGRTVPYHLGVRDHWMLVETIKGEMIDCPDSSGVSDSVTNEAYDHDKWAEHRKSDFPFADDFKPRNGHAFTRLMVFADANESVRKGIISAIKWGYPQGGRGGEAWFTEAFMSQRLEDTVAKLKAERAPAADVIEALNTHPGLNTATTSKIAYFARIVTQEGPCLIYDQMVRRAIRHRSDPEFAELKARLIRRRSDNPLPPPYEYAGYLVATHSMAKNWGVPSDALELFLFRIGRVLGPLKN